MLQRRNEKKDAARQPASQPLVALLGRRSRWESALSGSYRLGGG
jgi:hypothetical protein